MSYSINVAIRPRPTSVTSNFIKIDSSKSMLHLTSRVGSSHHYTFDSVFNTSTTQDQVYNDLGKPMLSHALKGFNSCLFAYGQTGSGKTHTINGLIPCFMNDLFSSIDKETASIHVGILEIYREKAKDLLKPVNTIKIRSIARGDVFVEGQEYTSIQSHEQFEQIYTSALRNRTVAQTALNDESSRSHCILTIKIKQLKKSQILNSIIQIIDLAGSERIEKSKVEGVNKQEAVSINKSLSTLNRVISLLAVKKTNDHIPFRDSILTHLLSNCLGGNSMTTMIATISMNDDYIGETENTLKYAQQAKRIVSEIHANIEELGDTQEDDLSDMNDDERKTILLMKQQDAEWTRQLEETREELMKARRALDEQLTSNRQITDLHAITQNKLAELEKRIQQERCAKMDDEEDSELVEIIQLREVESALELEKQRTQVQNSQLAEKSSQIQDLVQQLQMQKSAPIPVAEPMPIPVVEPIPPPPVVAATPIYEWSLVMQFATINSQRTIEYQNMRINITPNKCSSVLNGKCGNMYGQRGTNNLSITLTHSTLTITINGSKFSGLLQSPIEKPSSTAQIVTSLKGYMELK
jgi:hypothetical protein